MSILNPTNAQSQSIEERQLISWEQAVSMGIVFREAKDRSQWELGDLAVKVYRVFGFGSLTKLATDIAINKKTLQAYYRVSESFPEHDRIYMLSHRHHLTLAGRVDRKAWITRASDNNWTVEQLEYELAKADGKNPPDKLAPPLLTECMECHGWQVQSGKLCHCHSTFTYGKK